MALGNEVEFSSYVWHTTARVRLCLTKVVASFGADCVRIVQRKKALAILGAARDGLNRNKIKYPRACILNITSDTYLGTIF